MLEQEKEHGKSELKSLSHLKDQLKDVKSTRIVTVFHGQCTRIDCCTTHEYKIEVDEDSPLKDGDYAYKKDIEGARSIKTYGSRQIDKRIKEVKGGGKTGLGKFFGK